MSDNAHLKLESSDAQLKLESSPTQRMSNNNFPVRPVFDKEMTMEESKRMRNRSDRTSIPDSNFVLEDVEEEDPTDKRDLSLYLLTKKQNNNAILA